MTKHLQAFTTVYTLCVDIKVKAPPINSYEINFNLITR